MPECMASSCSDPIWEKRRCGLCQKHYGRIHVIPQREIGSASQFNCLGCNRQAQCWAWIHNTHPYKLKSYKPMCWKCHNDYDRPSDLSQKISATLIGNKRRVGTKASAETRARMSAAKIGNTNHTGKLASDETKRRMSIAKIGNTNSASRGKDTPEVRAKKSAGAKAAWERRKNGQVK